MILDLTPEQRMIVLEVLRAHLPIRVRAWVFGSRATGRARRYSDLDLAIEADRELTLEEMATLREVFDECDLPFNVDLLDWRQASDSFRRAVEEERVPLV